MIRASNGSSQEQPSQEDQSQVLELSGQFISKFSYSLLARHNRSQSQRATGAHHIELENRSRMSIDDTQTDAMLTLFKNKQQNENNNSSSGNNNNSDAENLEEQQPEVAGAREESSEPKLSVGPVDAGKVSVRDEFDFEETEAEEEQKVQIRLEQVQTEQSAGQSRAATNTTTSTTKTGQIERRPSQRIQRISRQEPDQEQISSQETDQAPIGGLQDPDNRIQDGNQVSGLSNWLAEDILTARAIVYRWPSGAGKAI